MPTVTRVRKEFSGDRTHRHIEGVCADDGNYYTRAQVVAGVLRGEDWHTFANGQRAPIRMVRWCPAPGCIASPYITTRRDSSADDNLENLPAC